LKEEDTMRLQLAGALAAGLALLGCGGQPITQLGCDDAAKPARWAATFKLGSGPSDCPGPDLLDRTADLPGGACAAGCSCAESSIVWVPASGAQQTTGTCRLNLSQQCPDASSLDCRDVSLDSATHASGNCYFDGTGKSGSFQCLYSVSWEKQ
jgi:hypothetical protein